MATTDEQLFFPVKDNHILPSLVTLNGLGRQSKGIFCPLVLREYNSLVTHGCRTHHSLLRTCVCVLHTYPGLWLPEAGVPSCHLAVVIHMNLVSLSSRGLGFLICKVWRPLVADSDSKVAHLVQSSCTINIWPFRGHLTRLGGRLIRALRAPLWTACMSLCRF